jgi:hypothetical protein
LKHHCTSYTKPPNREISSSSDMSIALFEPGVVAAATIVATHTGLLLPCSKAQGSKIQSHAMTPAHTITTSSC